MKALANNALAIGHQKENIESEERTVENKNKLSLKKKLENQFSRDIRIYPLKDIGFKGKKGELFQPQY